MSLVGSSSSSCGNGKLHSQTGSSQSSALSASTVSSNKPKILRGTESYSTDSYEPNYFLDSPTSEFIRRFSSSIPEDPFNAEDFNYSHSDLGLDYLESHSTQALNCDEDMMKLKLQELERALLDGNDEDVNTNTSPFLPRFVEAYNYYHAVFETLDATLPRDSQDRMNVEKQCLARDIVNVVACEGEDRIERYEVAGKWRARMMMAGFDVCPIGPNVSITIRELIKKYIDRFKVKEEINALHFGWEDRVLIVASAWR